MRAAILGTMLAIAGGWACGGDRAAHTAPAAARHTVAWSRGGAALTVDARWELDLASRRWHAPGAERPIVTPTLTSARDPAAPRPGVPDPGGARSAWEQDDFVCVVELAAPAQQVCYKIPLVP